MHSPELTGLAWWARLRLWGSFVRFSHTVFALPFALASLAVAFRGRPFEGRVLALVLLAMVTARSAAMAFNRIVDREYDRRNPRTAMRELPSGRLSLRAAWGFFAINAAGFLLAAALISPLCLALAPVALAVLLGYSYSKRFTALSHFLLGAALGLAPVGAWLAATGRLEPAPALLGAAVLFWVAGFDILYALQDVDFDRQAGLYSVPARIGIRPALRISAASHGLCALLLAGFGLQAQLGLYFWIGYAGFLLALLRQHRLVSPEDLSRLDQAFFTANGWASLWIGAWTILDVLLT